MSQPPRDERFRLVDLTEGVIVVGMPGQNAVDVQAAIDLLQTQVTAQQAQIDDLTARVTALESTP